MHVLVFVCLSLNGMLSDFILLHFFLLKRKLFSHFFIIPPFVVIHSLIFALRPEIEFVRSYQSILCLFA